MSDKPGAIIEIASPCPWCGKQSSLTEIGNFNCGATVPAAPDWLTATCGTCEFLDAVDGCRDPRDCRRFPQWERKPMGRHACAEFRQRS